MKRHRTSTAKKMMKGMAMIQPTILKQVPMKCPISYRPSSTSASRQPRRDGERSRQQRSRTPAACCGLEDAPAAMHASAHLHVRPNRVEQRGALLGFEVVSCRHAVGSDRVEPPKGSSRLDLGTDTPGDRQGVAIAQRPDLPGDPHEHVKRRAIDLVPVVLARLLDDLTLEGHGRQLHADVHEA